MSDELLGLRKEIDRLDAEILIRLAERARNAVRIGEIKQGVNIYRPEREAQVLERLGEMNPGPLTARAVQHIFREIMSACLSLEQPLKIAHLGPSGTFSESAARKHFGTAPWLSALPTVDDVFREVQSRRASYGVVPVENSTEGAVGGTLDLLLSSPLKISGEINLRIHQHLMSQAEDTSAIKRVYSHAQSLAQCHRWLNQNQPLLAQVPVVSNAEAARLAAQDREAAAIAGEAASLHYGLNILASNIEDDLNNTTRFVVIGDHDAAQPTGKDKTSLVCAAVNTPGAMYALLEPFVRYHVDLSRLQSRPARGKLWEYVFFIDFKGHQMDDNVKKALQELEQRAAVVKILGSYPAAVI